MTMLRRGYPSPLLSSALLILEDIVHLSLWRYTSEDFAGQRAFCEAYWKSEIPRADLDSQMQV